MATCNRNADKQTKGNLFHRVQKANCDIYNKQFLLCVAVVVGEMIKTNHYLRLSLIMYRRVLTMGSKPQLAKGKKNAMASSHSHSIFPESINRRIHGWDDFGWRNERIHGPESIRCAIGDLLFDLVVDGNYYVTHTFPSIIKNRMSARKENSKSERPSEQGKNKSRIIITWQQNQFALFRFMQRIHK